MVKHDVILRGYGSAANDRAAPPLLVKRTEPAFVPALLEALRHQTAATTLGATEDNDHVDLGGTAYRRLFQPVHRTFNLVVLEAVCDAPGHPRIHPSDISSAGFVVRRVAAVAQPDRDEAWQLRVDQPLGWAAPSSATLDPDPAHRRPIHRAGNPHINAMLAKRFADPEPAERITTLFVAPPDVCTAAGRTLLYGVIPVVSADETPVTNTDALVSAEDVAALLPPFLFARGGNYSPKFSPGSISTADVDAALAVTDVGDADYSALANLRRYVLGLRTLQSALRVFDDSPDSAVLRGLIDGVQLAYRDTIPLVDTYIDTPVSLGQFLRASIATFITNPVSNTAMRIPEVWPYPDTDTAQKIADAALALLRARHKASPPRSRRFDNDRALYRIHAFVRVRHTPECPPHLHWARPSEPFAIAPWWEAGPIVHTIPLPDIADFSKLKPNVAFTLPPSLANLLNQGDPKKLMEGTGKLSASPAIMWICSFSLPAITICAFIVLNIFLQLFNLIFGWMFSIKICLPFKKL